MSLDQNLFTLHLVPNKDDPNVVDLVDNSPDPISHYRKQRVPGSVYKIEVYDPFSESLLITATAPSATSKQKILELSNPTSVVELKYTGTIAFRWAFKWEEHEFEWKREECFLIRKPDPPVLVAVTKVTPGRLKTSTVQLLDYNLNRFDINDRKGLEIVILTALLTFQDSNDQYHTPREDSTPVNTPVGGTVPTLARNDSEKGPTVPPKPAPRTGVERIAEMQRARGEYNEINVEDEGSVNDYARYSSNLLQDDALLFITLRSNAVEQVPKVLQVVEETKRIRHKAGLEDEELHQYVLYDSGPSQKGPKRINLDDSDKGKGRNDYTPPTSLTVHLSKIPMPELQPKASVYDKGKEKAKRKEERKASPSRPEPNQSTRPNAAASTRDHILPHQTHPHQPSPSPAQLNNPSIYVAPPPDQPPSAPFFQFPKPWSHNTPDPTPHVHTIAMPSSQGGQQLAQPTPARASSQPPPGQQAGVPRPVTPSGVVSGLFDMLHIR